MRRIWGTTAWITLAAGLIAAGCTSASHSSGSAPSTLAPSTGPAAPPSTARPAPIPPAAWLTYQHDAGRSGVDSTVPAAGPIAKVWTSAAMNGEVYAQPLAVGDKVIAATEGDSVYALSAPSGAVLWSTKLGNPVPGSSLPCGDIDPSGITGTPVVDPVAGLVWVVAFVQPTQHVLVALDLATGQVRSRRPIDPPGADPSTEQERGALTISGGTVYVPFGGLYGDCGKYHGYIVGVGENGAGAPAVWEVPTAREAGIWAPPGPVVGPGGDLFVATGNGASTTAFDDGNAVVRLSPDLHQVDVFAPVNWAQLGKSDTDLGSVSPSLLPGGLVFQIGKEGVGYLMEAGRLGGVDGQVFSEKVCSGAYGGTAVSGSRIFVPCRDGLVALNLESDHRFTVVWRQGQAGAGTPVVAGGVVWMIGTDGQLWGFDQSTGAVRDKVQLGSVTHFPALSVGGDQLFAPVGASIVSFRGA